MRQPKRLYLPNVAAQQRAQPYQPLLPRRVRKQLKRQLVLCLRRFRFAIGLLAEAATEAAQQLVRMAEGFRQRYTEHLMQSAFIIRPNAPILIGPAY